MSNTVEQIGINIENVFAKLETYTFLAFTNENLQDILLERNFDNSDGQLVSIYKDLDSILSYYFYNEKYLASAVIYSANGGKYVYKDTSSYHIEQFRNANWLENMMSWDGSVRWNGMQRIGSGSGQDGSLFTVSRVLKDVKHQKPLRSIGMLYLSFSEKIFSDIYADFHAEPGSSMMIIDETGRVVSHKDKALILADMGDESYMERVLKDDKGIFVHSYNGKKSLISYYKINPINWRIVEFVPYSFITGQIIYIVLLTVLICGACLICIYAISLFLSKRFVRPLLQLNQAMKEVEKGRFDTSIPVATPDEIGQINNHFNKMVMRIKELFEQTIEQEREIRQEELKALQYQVNPHFLYNTLNSIRLMAMISKAGHVAAMTEALIRLLRNTIGKIGSMVPVAVEIENIKDYLYIHRVRYQDQIQVDYMLDEQILPCMMPNFILQPLVENAIFHGFEPRSGKGRIVIRGGMEADSIVISLQDDGIGMTEEHIRHIFSRKENKAAFVSIGIKNVNDRIRLSLGSEYGIDVKSIVGEGTVVYVRLPLIFQREER
ncbi:MAG: sensor histidine kinase [Cohnella sp.]|nr:sensor histidine kinase [Cohnella sp.]